MPSINRLYEKFKDQGFEVLLIDIMEDKNTVEKAVEDRGYIAPVALDSTAEVTKSYGVRGTPTVSIVDREGQIIGQAVGPKAWDSEEGRELIKSLIEKAP